PVGIGLQRLVGAALLEEARRLHDLHRVGRGREDNGKEIVGIERDRRHHPAHLLRPEECGGRGGGLLRGRILLRPSRRADAEDRRRPGEDAAEDQPRGGPDLSRKKPEVHTHTESSTDRESSQLPLRPGAKASTATPAVYWPLVPCRQRAASTPKS